MSTYIKKIINQQKIWLICILICIITPFIKPSFISFSNIWGVLLAMPTYGITALGLTFILISYELDISIGSIMAVSGVMFAILIRIMPFIPAMLVLLAFCAAIGAISGFLVSFFKLDSFVISLSIMTSVRGLALAIAKEKPIIINNNVISFLSKAGIGPIPLIFFIFLALVFLAEYILKQTQFGRNIYAIGGNKEVAESTGINIKFYKFIVFVISAVGAGLGGFMLICRMHSGSPIIGEDAPLNVLPMVIIGGTALSGGKGGAIKTLSGVILMSLIFNVMSLFNIYINIQSLVKGAIMLLIVVFDKYYANQYKKI